MNVFRHEHIAQESKAIAASRILEDSEKQIASRGRLQLLLTPVTAKGDEVGENLRGNSASDLPSPDETKQISDTMSVISWGQQSDVPLIPNDGMSGAPGPMIPISYDDYEICSTRQEPK